MKLFYKTMLSVALVTMVMGVSSVFSGAAYFTAWFDIINDPTFGYHASQYAPATLDLFAFSYSYTDTTTTRFRFDCQSDGVYDLDQTVAINPTYAYDGNGQGYFKQGGAFTRYENPRSPQPAYWASIRDASLKCYYPLPGDYTITMLAERDGVQSRYSMSFNLREPAVDMVVKPMYKEKIIEDIYHNSSKGDQNRDNVPKPPADVDLALSIWNPLPFPLFASTATLRFDCDDDGVYEKTDSWPKPATSEQGDNFCDYSDPYTSGSADCLGSFGYQLSYYKNVCHYDKPGAYRARVRAELPRSGAGPYIWEPYADATVLTNTATSLGLSTGVDPSVGGAPLNGIDLRAGVSGIVWAHANYEFDCNNGQTGSGFVNADFNKRKYDQDYSYTAKDLCNYDSAGEYAPSVDVQIRAQKLPGGIDGIENVLPGLTEVSRSATEIVYKEKRQTKVAVTGKLATCSGADECYSAESPFDIEWEVSNARPNACSIKGLDTSLSKTNTTGSGTISEGDLPPGEYRYTLSCLGDGGYASRAIKIKVVTGL